MDFSSRFGFFGALYPVICTAQGWLAYNFCLGLPMSLSVWEEMSNSSVARAPWGLVAELLVGLIPAWHEMRRVSARDRSGLDATGRLLSNSAYLAVYALLIGCTNWLLVMGLFTARWVSIPNFRFYFPAFFFLIFGPINGGAILWATIRTATTDDVLNPRVLAAKLRRSTRLTGQLLFSCNH